MNTHDVYGYEDYESKEASLASYVPELFTRVTVKPINESGLITTGVAPLRCYDNAMQTVAENAHRNTRFCIGLQHSVGEPDIKVEHCWVEHEGGYFDPNPLEVMDSVYLLFRSYSIKEMLAIMDALECIEIPNIVTLQHYRIKA